MVICGSVTVCPEIRDPWFFNENSSQFVWIVHLTWQKRLVGPCNFSYLLYLHNYAVSTKFCKQPVSLKTPPVLKRSPQSALVSRKTREFSGFLGSERLLHVWPTRQCVASSGARMAWEKLPACQSKARAVQIWKSFARLPHIWASLGMTQCTVIVLSGGKPTLRTFSATRDL